MPQLFYDFISLSSVDIHIFFWTVWGRVGDIVSYYPLNILICFPKNKDILTTVKWSKPQNLIVIQYSFIINSLYSNFANWFKNTIYNYFFPSLGAIWHHIVLWVFVQSFYLLTVTLSRVQTSYFAKYSSVWDYLIFHPPSWITALLWYRALHNSMNLWAMLCRASQDRQAVAEFQQNSRRRQGHQWMSWLDSITDTMNGCCSPRGHKKSDMTGQLNNNHVSS